MAKQLRTCSTGPLTSLLAILICAGAALPARAQGLAADAQSATPTTRLLPVSGVLSDTKGQPRRGPAVVTFGLYDAHEGGTLLWTETQRVQPDERGRYSVYLGVASPLPQDVFSKEEARWLAVEVDGRQLPRMALVAVPYALHAADADTLGGQPAASYVRRRPDGRIDGVAGVVAQDAAVDGSGVPGQLAKFSSPMTLSSSVISESATNRIGVGLSDPTGGGVVDSVFTIRNFDNNTGFAILNDAQHRRFALNTLVSGGWLLYDGGNSTWNSGLSPLNGRVGIGTPAPVDLLHIKSTGSPSIRLDGPVNSSSGAKLRFTEDSGVTGGTGFETFLDAVTNTLIWRSIDFNTVQNDNILVMKRASPNNVGIGLLDPLDKLHVAGDIRVGTGTNGCVKDAGANVIAGVCSSDRRFKKDITPFEPALDKVARLQPVHFYWRAEEYTEKHFGAGEAFGLIAQDVETVLPELVTVDAQGYKAVRYNALPFHMLQAIRELKAENDALKQRLEQQDERLRRLEERK